MRSQIRSSIDAAFVQGSANAGIASLSSLMVRFRYEYLYHWSITCVTADTSAARFTALDVSTSVWSDKRCTAQSQKGSKLAAIIWITARMSCRAVETEHGRLKAWGADQVGSRAVDRTDAVSACSRATAAPCLAEGAVFHSLCQPSRRWSWPVEAVCRAVGDQCRQRHTPVQFHGRIK